MLFLGCLVPLHPTSLCLRRTSNTNAERKPRPDHQPPTTNPTQPNRIESTRFNRQSHHKRQSIDIRSHESIIDEKNIFSLLARACLVVMCRFGSILLLLFFIQLAVGLNSPNSRELQSEIESEFESENHDSIEWSQGYDHVLVEEEAVRNSET